MKRWYLCQVIGDGHSPETAYRSEIEDQLAPGDVAVPVIATLPDGTLRFPFALVLVGSKDHTRFTGDRFPDLTLDAKLSTLTLAQRNAALNFLSKRSIPTSGLNLNTTFREVLELVGKYIDINFNTLRHDVTE